MSALFMGIPSFCMIMQEIYTGFISLSREEMIKTLLEYNERAEKPGNERFMHLCRKLCI